MVIIAITLLRGSEQAITTLYFDSVHDFNFAAILQADMNPISYSGNPRLGTAVQLLRITDYIESKLHEVRSILLFNRTSVSIK